MPEFLSGLLFDIGVNSIYEQYLILGLLISWVVVLAVRGFLAAGYKGQLALVRSDIKRERDAKRDARKEVKEEGFAAKFNSVFFRRAAKDYSDLGERGVANINSRELVRKSAQRFKFIFWSYASIEMFLDAVEPALFFGGILLTVLAEAKQPFAVAVLIAFALGRLFASFFDYKSAKDELFAESAFWLDRELGKLFVTDISASINNLKTDLKNAVMYQTRFLGESIGELKDKLSDVSERTLGDTARVVSETLKNVTVNADIIKEPLEEWRTVILDSKKVHEDMNLSIIRMGSATDGFKEYMAELGRLIDGYRDEFLKNNVNVEKELERLNVMTAHVADACARSDAQTRAVEGALEFVRRNQLMLENSINQYELALKGISSSVGDGLGKIIDYHTQTSYRSLADGISENLHKVSIQNNELINKLQSLLDRILEQLKNETTLIMNLKEQIELENHA